MREREALVKALEPVAGSGSTSIIRPHRDYFDDEMSERLRPNC